jgi:ppGpp synthetase/RelA/SpoT-type nucleotidyltranferase
MPSTDLQKERQAFRDYYNDQIRLLQEASAFFQSLVTAVLRESPIEIDAVTTRVKDREECIQKFVRKYLEELEGEHTPYEIREWITDLIGVRVVCLYEPDVYEVEELLKRKFRRC